MRLSCTVFVICQKSPILTYRTCIWHLCWVTPFELRPDLWYQKTGGLSCGVVRIMLRYPFWHNSGEWQTDRHSNTDAQTHDDSIYCSSI